MMATTVLEESKSVPVIETVTAEAVSPVKCYCCGLIEECTPPYIDGVRERYQGRWICGLCAEAVKEEALKSKSQRDMTTDEAFKRHMRFCQKFRCSTSSSPNKHTHDLILAMKHLLFRSLDSPTPRIRKDPLTCRSLGRSQSCFSTMSATTQPEPHSESSGIVQGRD